MKIGHTALWDTWRQERSWRPLRKAPDRFLSEVPLRAASAGLRGDPAPAALRSVCCLVRV